MAEILVVDVLDTSYAVRPEIVSKVPRQMPAEIGWLCIPK